MLTTACNLLRPDTGAQTVTAADLKQLEKEEHAQRFAELQATAEVTLHQHHTEHTKDPHHREKLHARAHKSIAAKMKTSARSASAGARSKKKAKKEGANTASSRSQSPTSGADEAADTSSPSSLPPKKKTRSKSDDREVGSAKAAASASSPNRKGLKKKPLANLITSTAEAAEGNKPKKPNTAVKKKAHSTSKLPAEEVKKSSEADDPRLQLDGPVKLWDQWKPMHGEEAESPPIVENPWKTPASTSEQAVPKQAKKPKVVRALKSSTADAPAAATTEEEMLQQLLAAGAKMKPQGTNAEQGGGKAQAIAVMHAVPAKAKSPGAAAAANASIAAPDDLRWTWLAVQDGVRRASVDSRKVLAATTELETTNDGEPTKPTMPQKRDYRLAPLVELLPVLASKSSVEDGADEHEVGGSTRQLRAFPLVLAALRAAAQDAAQEESATQQAFSTPPTGTVVVGAGDIAPPDDSADQQRAAPPRPPPNKAKGLSAKSATLLLHLEQMPDVRTALDELMIGLLSDFKELSDFYYDTRTFALNFERWHTWKQMFQLLLYEKKRKLLLTETESDRAQAYQVLDQERKTNSTTLDETREKLLFCEKYVEFLKQQFVEARVKMEPTVEGLRGNTEKYLALQQEKIKLDAERLEPTAENLALWSDNVNYYVNLTGGANSMESAQQLQAQQEQLPTFGLAMPASLPAASLANAFIPDLAPGYSLAHRKNNEAIQITTNAANRDSYKLAPFKTTIQWQYELQEERGRREQLENLLATVELSLEKFCSTVHENCRSVCKFLVRERVEVVKRAHWGWGLKQVERRMATADDLLKILLGQVDNGAALENSALEWEDGDREAAKLAELSTTRQGDILRRGGIRNAGRKGAGKQGAIRAGEDRFVEETTTSASEREEFEPAPLLSLPLQPVELLNHADLRMEGKHRRTKNNTASTANAPQTLLEQTQTLVDKLARVAQEQVDRSAAPTETMVRTGDALSNTMVTVDRVEASPVRQQQVVRASAANATANETELNTSRTSLGNSTARRLEGKIQRSGFLEGGGSFRGSKNNDGESWLKGASTKQSAIQFTEAGELALAPEQAGNRKKDDRKAKPSAIASEDKTTNRKAFVETVPLSAARNAVAAAAKSEVGVAEISQPTAAEVRTMNQLRDLECSQLPPGMQPEDGGMIGRDGVTGSGIAVLRPIQLDRVAENTKRHEEFNLHLTLDEETRDDPAVLTNGPPSCEEIKQMSELREKFEKNNLQSGENRMLAQKESRYLAQKPDFFVSDADFLRASAVKDENRIDIVHTESEHETAALILEEEKRQEKLLGKVDASGQIRSEAKLAEARYRASKLVEMRKSRQMEQQNFEVHGARSGGFVPSEMATPSILNEGRQRASTSSGRGSKTVITAGAAGAGSIIATGTTSLSKGFSAAIDPNANGNRQDVQYDYVYNAEEGQRQHADLYAATRQKSVTAAEVLAQAAAEAEQEKHENLFALGGASEVAAALANEEKGERKAMKALRESHATLESGSSASDGDADENKSKLTEGALLKSGQVTTSAEVLRASVAKGNVRGSASSQSQIVKSLHAAKSRASLKYDPGVRISLAGDVLLNADHETTFASSTRQSLQLRRSLQKKTSMGDVLENTPSDEVVVSGDLYHGEKDAFEDRSLGGKTGEKLQAQKLEYMRDIYATVAHGELKLDDSSTEMDTSTEKEQAGVTSGAPKDATSGASQDATSAPVRGPGAGAGEKGTKSEILEKGAKGSSEKGAKGSPEKGAAAKGPEKEAAAKVSETGAAAKGSEKEAAAKGSEKGGEEKAADRARDKLVESLTKKIRAALVSKCMDEAKKESVTIGVRSEGRVTSSGVQLSFSAAGNSTKNEQGSTSSSIAPAGAAVVLPTSGSLKTGGEIDDEQNPEAFVNMNTSKLAQAESRLFVAEQKRMTSKDVHIGDAAEALKPAEQGSPATPTAGKGLVKFVPPELIETTAAEQQQVVKDQKTPEASYPDFEKFRAFGADSAADAKSAVGAESPAPAAGTSEATTTKKKKKKAPTNVPKVVARQDTRGPTGDEQQIAEKVRAQIKDAEKVQRGPDLSDVAIAKRISKQLELERQSEASATQKQEAIRESAAMNAPFASSTATTTSLAAAAEEGRISIASAPVNANDDVNDNDDNSANSAAALNFSKGNPTTNRAAMSPTPAPLKLQVAATVGTTVAALKATPPPRPLLTPLQKFRAAAKMVGRSSEVLASVRKENVDGATALPDMGEITVISASNLFQESPSLPMNTFVKVIFGDTEKHTHVVPNTKNPDWKLTLVFPHPQCELVHFEVWNSPAFGQSDSHDHSDLHFMRQSIAGEKLIGKCELRVRKSPNGAFLRRARMAVLPLVTTTQSQEGGEQQQSESRGEITVDWERHKGVDSEFTDALHELCDNKTLQVSTLADYHSHLLQSPAGSSPDKTKPPKVNLYPNWVRFLHELPLAEEESEKRETLFKKLATYKDGASIAEAKKKAKASDVGSPSSSSENDPPPKITPRSDDSNSDDEEDLVLHRDAVANLPKMMDFKLELPSVEQTLFAAFDHAAEAHADEDEYHIRFDGFYALLFYLYDVCLLFFETKVKVVEKGGGGKTGEVSDESINSNALITHEMVIPNEKDDKIGLEEFRKLMPVFQNWGLPVDAEHVELYFADVRGNQTSEGTEAAKEQKEKTITLIEAIKWACEQGDDCLISRKTLVAAENPSLLEKAARKHRGRRGRHKNRRRQWDKNLKKWVNVPKGEGEADGDGEDSGEDEEAGGGAAVGAADAGKDKKQKA
eukprot:g8738.t1